MEILPLTAYSLQLFSCNVEGKGAGDLTPRPADPPTSPWPYRLELTDTACQAASTTCVR